MATFRKRQMEFGGGLSPRPESSTIIETMKRTKDLLPLVNFFAETLSETLDR